MRDSVFQNRNPWGGGSGKTIKARIKKRNVGVSVVFNPRWGISRTGVIYRMWPEGLKWNKPQVPVGE